MLWIDESGFAEEMPRLFGYSSKGQRCFGVSNWNYKKRTNVIGALFNKTLFFSQAFQSSIQSDVFEKWFKELVKRADQHAVFLMDNASFHRKKELPKLLRSQQQILFLPPYSPDLNPIEKYWAKLKKHRRKHQCTLNQTLLSNCIDFIPI